AVCRVLFRILFSSCLPFRPTTSNRRARPGCVELAICISIPYEISGAPYAARRTRSGRRRSDTPDRTRSATPRREAICGVYRNADRFDGRKTRLETAAGLRSRRHPEQRPEPSEATWPRRVAGTARL